MISFLALLAAAAPAAPAERGMALGLFSMDQSFDYRTLVEEIHELGTTHLSIAWVMWQDDIRATEIKAEGTWTASEAQIVRTMRLAKAMGMHVTAFPILRLIRSTRTEWRGKIAPEDEEKWWASYRDFMLSSARLAREGRADRLCIGSELVSREHLRARWLAVIGAVRKEAPKLELLYSANWDHYEEVSFWDAVDVVGITGYWELTKSLEPSKKELTGAWVPIKNRVESWSKRIARPVVITEVGYPSLDGGAAWPWDETRSSTIDLQEQRIAYEAFVESWSDTPFLEGVYFWNWFGFGGPKDTNYTPRGKPAASVIRSWYRR